MKYKQYLAYSLLAAALLLAGHAGAQRKKDSLALYREFVAVSKNYQQLPLQARILFRKSTVPHLAGKGSESTLAEFYLQKGDGYIKFGELEQVVNDSLMLLVNNRMKMFMLVKQEAGTMDKSLTMFPGLPKASLEAMGKKYLAEKQVVNDVDTLIKLSTRKLLQGTDKPLEEVEIRYSGSMNPVVARTVKRKLLPLTDTTGASKDIPNANRVHIDMSGDYLLSEEVNEYLFQYIAHAEGIVVPVTLSNRLVKNAAGEWVPAKGYEGYSIRRQQ